MGPRSLFRRFEESQVELLALRVHLHARTRTRTRTAIPKHDSAVKYFPRENGAFKKQKMRIRKPWFFWIDGMAGAAYLPRDVSYGCDFTN